MSNYLKPQWRPCYVEASDPRIVQSRLKAKRPALDSIGRNGKKIQNKRERAGKKRVTYQEKIDMLRKANEADGYDYQWMENEKDESQKETRGSYSEKRRRLMEADLSQLSDPVLSTTTAAPVMTWKVESERWSDGWNQPVKRKRKDDDEEMQKKKIREEEQSLMDREVEDSLVFSSLYPEVSLVEGPGDQPSTAGLSTSPTSAPFITLSNVQIDELWNYSCDFPSDVQPTEFQDSEPDDCIDASSLDAQLRELLYQSMLLLC